MKELWLDMVGFEGIYQISNTGRVKSLARKKGFIFGRERIIKTPPHVKTGYPMLYIKYRGKKLALYVHRVVAQHFVLNPLNKPQVNHVDGCRTNNSADNLEWVTPLENVLHARDILHCDFSLGSKLCEEDVISIRSKYARGNITQKELGSMYDIGQDMVSKIINYIHWRNI
jgi:hypothetical protein